MQIQISPTDGVPIYQQIVSQVRYLIAAGRLQAGEELPPIRTLALQLKVTPNTIVAAVINNGPRGAMRISTKARPTTTIAVTAA